jgi:hypothetical protein
MALISSNGKSLSVLPIISYPPAIFGEWSQFLPLLLHLCISCVYAEEHYTRPAYSADAADHWFAWTSHNLHRRYMAYPRRINFIKDKYHKSESEPDIFQLIPILTWEGGCCSPRRTAYIGINTCHFIEFHCKQNVVLNITQPKI